MVSTQERRIIFFNTLAPITHAHAARGLGDEPSKIEVSTRHEFIILGAIAETQVTAEIKVRYGCSLVSYLDVACAECVHMVQIGDWLLITYG